MILSSDISQHLILNKINQQEFAKKTAVADTAILSYFHPTS